MSNKTCLLFLFIVLSFSIGCLEKKDSISPVIDRTTPEHFIRGNVILENQTNPAHCPVIFDKFMIGTITDSLGYYEIFIPDSLADLTGTFKVYYYLYDYDLDSLSVRIDKGKVKWGQEDVDDEGLLKTMTLKQIISMEVTSDKNQCIVGEYVRFSAIIKNKSQRTLTLSTSDIIMFGFHDIHSKSTSWRGVGGASSDNPHIEPGGIFNHDTNIAVKQVGEGYFFPVHSLKRGYKIPVFITEFIWNSRFKYENLVTSGFSFFVFINDPKNLSFPIVKVVQN